MAGYRAVCRADELRPGRGRQVEVDGKDIALFLVDGEIHALENVCLHAGGPLHEGTLEDGYVVCPWHQWRFELKTGRCGLHAGSLATYPVRVVDGNVELLLA
jgi:nitrite reductase/ring-hydroxylating ferredoxin subunit